MNLIDLIKTEIKSNVFLKLKSGAFGFNQKTVAHLPLL